MAVDKKLTKNLEGLLEPGEEIRAVTTARTGHPYLWVISITADNLSNRYRILVATDRRVLLCTRFLSKIDVLGALPRGTPLGVRRGLFYYRCDGLGETVYTTRWQYNRFEQLSS